MTRGPVVTHWSLPPQHAGYWTRIGGGDGWPELGGRGPRPGPHIPGLVPGWHDSYGHNEHSGLPVHIPRGGFTVARGPGEPRPGRRSARGFNLFRPARRAGAPRWR